MRKRERATSVKHEVLKCPNCKNPSRKFAFKNETRFRGGTSDWLFKRMNEPHESRFVYATTRHSTARDKFKFKAQPFIAAAPKMHRRKHKLPYLVSGCRRMRKRTRRRARCSTGTFVWAFLLPPSCRLLWRDEVSLCFGARARSDAHWKNEAESEGWSFSCSTCVHTTIRAKRGQESFLNLKYIFLTILLFFIVFF